MTQNTNDNGKDKKIVTFRPRRKSPRPTPEMREKMKEMYHAGMMQHDIAAHFGVNQGRVSEAVNNK